MCEEIQKHYEDILPEDVNNEIIERLKEIEVNQAEEIEILKSKRLNLGLSNIFTQKQILNTI